MKISLSTYSSGTSFADVILFLSHWVPVGCAAPTDRAHAAGLIDGTSFDRFDALFAIITLVVAYIAFVCHGHYKGQNIFQ